MLILFVIDTSSSMNQKTAHGMTLLDCAKAAVEHFVKIRGRDPATRSDRYFLVTCEEGLSAIKVRFIIINNYANRRDSLNKYVSLEAFH